MIWNSIVEPDRPQMTIRPMRIACRIIKATYTQSEYVIFTVFPPKHWLHERFSLLRYTYLAVLLVHMCNIFLKSHSQILTEIAH